MGLAGRVLSEALASPSPVVGEELHDAGPSEDHAAQHMLAVSIVVLIVLLLLSLAIGQWLHSKHIYYIPESGVTIIIGFVSGYFVSAWFGTDIEQEETLLYFDPMFFTLFLLPPIIFEAGYSLDMPLFKKNLPKILALAILGTLISAAVTWYALYTDATDFLIDLSLTESGQFAALISAIDPVATLSLFSALKVDPSLNNIVVGESVLNDAVALISFRAVTHFGINMKDEWEAIILSFVVTGVGSSIVGLTIGFSAALLFKLMGMGKPNRSDLPHVECVAFVMFAYVSFVAAELSDNSGIVSALFAGFTMRAYARPNLSAVARPVVDALLKVMSSMADSIIYLLVGFAITIELEYLPPPRSTTATARTHSLSPTHAQPISRHTPADAALRRTRRRAATTLRHRPTRAAAPPPPPHPPPHNPPPARRSPLPAVPHTPHRTVRSAAGT
jgi:sodium/hydrogen exchanger 8